MRTSKSITSKPKQRGLKQALTSVRDALLGAQQQLKQSKSHAVVVIITDVPTAGRSEVVNELLAWLDPKLVSVYSPDRDHCEEKEHPLMWRYWRHLPARGRIAFFFEGWYDGMIRGAVGKKSKTLFEPRSLERIVQFERMLIRDRVRVLKIHLHVSRTLQQRRLDELRANKLTRWRVSDSDRWFARHHDAVDKVAKRLRAATDHAESSWHVVDGSQPEARVLAVAQHLNDQLTADAAGSEPLDRQVLPPLVSSPMASTSAQDFEEDYELELERLQGRLAVLTRKKDFSKRALVLAFEGMDAAGKGGAIRRVTHALDARQYRVMPVSAPSADELLYPYLWRFWRDAPRCGDIVIFDRSWYGRVLVERVRGFAAVADWERAYEEINELERQWCEHGAALQKFWLAVSPGEQLKRFEARESDPLKRFKVDPEDWENRKLYEQYQTAAVEMIARTHRDHAPWARIAADDKKSARLQVLRTIVQRLEAAI